MFGAKIKRRKSWFSGKIYGNHNFLLLNLDCGNIFYSVELKTREEKSKKYTTITEIAIISVIAGSSCSSCFPLSVKEYLKHKCDESPSLDIRACPCGLTGRSINLCIVRMLSYLRELYLDRLPVVYVMAISRYHPYRIWVQENKEMKWKQRYVLQ